MSNEEKKLTKDEGLKESSNFLRGTIKEQLSDETTSFNAENNKLLKFHGIYQQDDRDKRQALIKAGKEKAFSLMIRAKLPGGKLNSDQYLKLDQIADDYANKTLRITTRQTIQYHGVLKKDIKKTMNEINNLLITTFGACGDVVRNVITSPVCDIDPRYDIDLGKLSEEISTYFIPNTKAYYEAWVEDEEGDKVPDSKIEAGSENEPLYGKTYLPRKFKIALCVPEDNSPDIFTNDVGIVAIRSGKNVEGYNILVGGGMGHNHNKPETYPRVGSELCFVSHEDLIKTLEGIVLTQRDHGGRENRKHARMKYLIDDNGLDWFKKEVEKRVDKELVAPRKIEKYEFHDHVGWHKQIDGRWYLGIFIENGRVSDVEGCTTKAGLKEIIAKYKPEIRFTAQQNIVLCNIEEKDKEDIESILSKNGFRGYGENLSTIRRHSMACVSLPTCGLAIAEAERALPGIIDELEESGYSDEEISIRISGCPNSCSRPPASEIGIIGMGANKYNLYVGGDFNGTRLNTKLKENVLGEDLAKEIGSIIDLYKENKVSSERLGDYYSRVKS